MPDPLPPPAIAPEVYDEQYFAAVSAGAEAWSSSGASAIDPKFPGTLHLAGFAPGEVLVDIGTGRGELLVAAIAAGGARAIGLDYATSAIEMARRTVQAHGGDPRIELALADARRLPVADGTADLVTLLDVVEHLSPSELAVTLGEARRVLRPGGRIFVHTFPSRLIYDVTYRALRLAWLGALRGWPADPRNDYEHTMHVNEQTCRSLQRSLRTAGFADARAWPGEWLYVDFVPSRHARRVMTALARRRSTRRLGMANIFASATAP
jgi:ubiquinone/menaquinone biosynthesis C-methylase UbiE